MLLWHRARSADAVCTASVRASRALAALLALYALCWALAEGANVISPDGEMVWYSVLDLLAGPGALYGFLWALRDFDLDAYGIGSAGYGPGAPPAKAPPAGAPLPDGWGKPMAFWPATDCDPGKFFKSHSSIFDTTLWCVCSRALSASDASL